MLNKFFIILFVLYTSATSQLLGCDQGDLDSKASNIAGKIYNRQAVSEEMIRGTLTFIYDETTVREMYKSPVGFNALMSERTQALQDSGDFLTFASLCKNIYDKGTPLEQSAIHMLFLKASDYVQDFYYSRQKRTKAPNISAEVRRKNVLAFLNFDKEPLSNSDKDSVGAH